jgi:hypothetical protein
MWRFRQPRRLQRIECNKIRKNEHIRKTIGRQPKFSGMVKTLSESSTRLDYMCDIAFRRRSDTMVNSASVSRRLTEENEEQMQRLKRIWL